MKINKLKRYRVLHHLLGVKIIVGSPSEKCWIPNNIKDDLLDIRVLVNKVHRCVTAGDVMGWEKLHPSPKLIHPWYMMLFCFIRYFAPTQHHPFPLFFLSSVILSSFLKNYVTLMLKYFSFFNFDYLLILFICSTRNFLPSL